MKICILTQTAVDLSDFYKTFFKGYDLFFVTFKEKNRKAIDFLPSSTWSDGRNRLWEEVKGKYDYYLFIDDDLEFFKAKFAIYPYLHLAYQKYIGKETINCYKNCDSSFFFNELNSIIKKNKPEILSVRNLNNLINQSLDRAFLRNGSFFRPLGWFDAQFTLFSNYAAERLLPYDTIVSGWASAQILIYLISFHVFQYKAISLNSIGVNNSFHSGPYVADYKSNLDCKNMIDKICEATGRDFSDLFDTQSNHVNLFYGKKYIMNANPNINLNYQKNFMGELNGLESLMINNRLKF
ncbi:hypothetical protein A5893_14460 [Pedobacter psychrophilus]|uniref:Glycosyl transferase family 2 n=1 Tax=Pedobacter psychrophilus TaxID=1826909 RepID=A0A179DC41_9SPHI|nr:hypothetical protein [Pedobacter psychrophilus]OAQ38611.1 hypothetical protein A5893_14460 [Pedobacter psychrophilus]